MISSTVPLWKCLLHRQCELGNSLPLVHSASVPTGLSQRERPTQGMQRCIFSPKLAHKPRPLISSDTKASPSIGWFLGLSRLFLIFHNFGSTLEPKLTLEPNSPVWRGYITLLDNRVNQEDSVTKWDILSSFIRMKRKTEFLGVANQFNSYT